MMRKNLISRQSGAVLAISLIFLVVLTLLGITGAQNTIIEERMVSNFRDQQVAFEAAEAAMKEGEKRLRVYANWEAMAWDGTDGTHDGKISKDPLIANVGSESVTVVVAGIDGEVSRNPTYYIERLRDIVVHGSGIGVGFGEKRKMNYFRVTAKGWGKSTTTDPQVIIQSTFTRL